MDKQCHRLQGMHFPFLHRTGISLAFSRGHMRAAKGALLANALARQRPWLPPGERQGAAAVSFAFAQPVDIKNSPENLSSSEDLYNIKE